MLPVGFDHAKDHGILTFEMIERGSRRIDESKLLPGLAIHLLERALPQSHEADQSQVSQWLMQQFQS